jgi:hypothetical protein
VWFRIILACCSEYYLLFNGCVHNSVYVYDLEFLVEGWADVVGLWRVL